MFCEVRQSNAVDICTTQPKNGSTIMAISVSYGRTPWSQQDRCSAVDNAEYGRDQYRQWRGRWICKEL